MVFISKVMPAFELKGQQDVELVLLVEGNSSGFGDQKDRAVHFFQVGGYWRGWSR